MSDELQGCPFCGCSNIHADWHYNENSDGGGRGIVTCAECGVEVTSADPGWMNCQADRDKCVSDAIAAWNRRVPAPAPAVPDDVAMHPQERAIAQATIEAQAAELALKTAALEACKNWINTALLLVIEDALTAGKPAALTQPTGD